MPVEKQITINPGGHQLTNVHCWSHDGRFLVYDVRSGRDGSVFDGTRIERVDVETGIVELLYESTDGACCGVVTCSPVDERIVFIHGPENPDDDWSYSFSHRRGTILFPDGRLENLDACCVAPPLQSGALRGGSHVHVFDADGRWVSFTYNDHLLDRLDSTSSAPAHDPDQRNVGVGVPLRAVSVNRNHPRNHDGSHYSALVTRTVSNPEPESDEIRKAYEEGWVGNNGYLKPDGTHQRRALAFLGDVALGETGTAAEVFVVDLPENDEEMAVAGQDPLEGTTTHRPAPPRGVIQRRLTFTTDRRYPGVQGPRHWLRSSPDGSRIAFLMRDDNGVVQIRTISPNGGKPAPWTRNSSDVASAFSWSPEGESIAYVLDNSIVVTKSDGSTRCLTPRSADAETPLPYAVVFSPDGKKIAFMRNVAHDDGNRYNQIFVVSTD